MRTKAEQSMREYVNNKHRIVTAYFKLYPKTKVYGDILSKALEQATRQQAKELLEK